MARRGGMLRNRPTKSDVSIAVKIACKLPSGLFGMFTDELYGPRNTSPLLRYVRIAKFYLRSRRRSRRKTGFTGGKMIP